MSWNNPMSDNYMMRQQARTQRKSMREIRKNTRTPFKSSRHTKFHAMNCIEKKVHETDMVQATGGSAIQIQRLFDNVEQGTSYDKRVGDKVWLWDLNLKLRFCVNQTGTALCDNLDYVIAVDHDSQGAQATWTDIYDTTDGFSLRKLSNVRRFTILKRGVLQVTPAAGNGGPVDGGGLYSFKEYIVNCFKQFKHGIKVDYSHVDTLGNINTVIKNNIFIIFNFTGAFGLEAFMARDGICRIRYTD